MAGAATRAGEGPCSVVGTARRASALDAALVNGTAPHALDFDKNCAARALPAGQIGRLGAAIDAIEIAPSMRGIAALLTAR